MPQLWVPTPHSADPHICRLRGRQEATCPGYRRDSLGLGDGWAVPSARKIPKWGCDAEAAPWPDVGVMVAVMTGSDRGTCKAVWS